MNSGLSSRMRHARAIVVEGAMNVLDVCRRMTPPAMLSLLLILAWALGGAASSNAVLVAAIELAALGGLALVLLTQPRRGLPREARWPIGFMIAFVVVVGLQLVPLPWEVWSGLPGRAAAAEGLELLDLDGGFRPLSMAPENTVSALLKFIPPVAAFLIALLMPWRLLVATLRWAALVIAIASVVWAMAQVLGLLGNFGERSADNAAAGPFSNVNHQVSLLLMCLPFIIGSAGLARQQADLGESSADIALVWASGAFIVVIGVVLGGSLFGYLMAPFVIAGSVMIGSLKPDHIGWRTLAVGFALSLAALVAVLLTVGLDQLNSDGDLDQTRSRSAIFATTSEAIVDYAPLGSGLGAFDKVYPLYEGEGAVPETYVNAAHNDYLQVALELGVPGVLVVACLVIWLVVRVGSVWLQKQDYGSLLRMKMAASIALSVPLLHSLLDYPLRSPAVACFAATCLAVLVVQRRPIQADPAPEHAGPSIPGDEQA